MLLLWTQRICQGQPAFDGCVYWMQAPSLLEPAGANPSRLEAQHLGHASLHFAALLMNDG